MALSFAWTSFVSCSRRDLFRFLIGITIFSHLYRLFAAHSWHYYNHHLRQYQNHDSDAFWLPHRPIPMLTCFDGNRTIELPKDFPGFMIVGTQKGGTTALNKLLSLHPNILPSVNREPHFFDYRGNFTGNLTDEAVCHKRANYIFTYFDVLEFAEKAAYQHIMAFEKTPSYLRTPGVAERVYRFFPNLKVIVVIRNPVDRSYSFYNMQHERGAFLDESFDDLIHNEVVTLRQVNLTKAPPLFNYTSDMPDQVFAIPKLPFAKRREIVKTAKTPQAFKLKRMSWNTLYAGMYAMQLDEWIHYFDKNVKVIRFEHLMQDNVAVFRDILNFLDVPQIELHEDHFLQDYSPVKKKGKHGPADEMSPNTRAYLKRFFKPHNDELADLLGEEWRGVWDKDDDDEEEEDDESDNR